MRVTEVELPTFGSELSRYRTAAGLTQEDLAERASLSARAVSDFERGVIAKPRPYTLRQLAEALELTPEDRLQLEQCARATAATAAAPPATGRSIGDLPQGPLVGAEREMARLHALLEEVSMGSGRFVLFEGEPGVGKTRFLQE